MIEIRGLKKTFNSSDSSFEVLRGVDLLIPEGSIYGVIGSSGAGKSTLVRCINGLERFEDGEIIVDGEDISKLKGRALREAKLSMGMIFQQFNLLMQSNVEKNIRFPLDIEKVPKNKAKRRVDELLGLVGLSDKKRAYPATISGGQKQRVAIARALAANPKILLCDEATSALDPETTRSILNLLVEINRNFRITILIITHEMQVVKTICTHLAVLDEGVIVESGKTENVLKNPVSKAAKRLILGEQDWDKGLLIDLGGLNSASFDTYEPVIDNFTKGYCSK